MAARTTLSPGTLFGLFGPSLDGRSLADKPRRPLLLVASYATSHFANHIASVRSRLPSSAANWPVLVTTDETSPAYLAEIAALGWIVMDHAALRTSETYGVWYPSLVDNVVLSLGKGFVGTGSSTSESSGDPAACGGPTRRLMRDHWLTLRSRVISQCLFSRPDGSKTGMEARLRWSI